MSLHRPMDLDRLNDDFFASPNKPEKDEEQNEAFTQIVDTSSTEGVLEALRSVSFSNNDTIFHDLSETEEKKVRYKEEKTVIDDDDDIINEFFSGNTLTVSSAEEILGGDIEEDADYSGDEFKDIFPDVEFDPSIFKTEPDMTEEAEGNRTHPAVTTEIREEDEDIQEETSQSEEHLSDRDAIKKAKKEAKESIILEKEKIKQQKKIESTVQRTFSKRNRLRVITAVLLIIGIAVGALGGMMYSLSQNEKGIISLGAADICYIDGKKIDGQEHIGELIVAYPSEVQGNCNVLFTKPESGEYAFGDVIAFGEGIYAVDIQTSVVRVPLESIIGVSKFGIKNIEGIFGLIEKQSVVCAAVLACYFAVVIAFSAASLKKLNKKIKKFEEEYDLV